MKTDFTPRSLRQYIEKLSENSEYVFSTGDVIDKLKISKQALYMALSRLVKNRSIAKLRAGYYVITPIEYRRSGAPPPTWYIDQLMKGQGLTYYVGVLTAAAIHGAAHQQPQEFQVITTKKLPTMHVCSSRTRFITKQYIDELMYTKINTPTGTMNVSIPEMTAFDLVTYVEHSGHLSNVTTVLMELAEKIDPYKLVEVVKFDVNLTVVQRLGYLLDKYCDKRLTTQLHPWLKTHKINLTPLKPGRPINKKQKDKKWHVWINEKIEEDI